MRARCPQRAISWSLCRATSIVAFHEMDECLSNGRFYLACLGSHISVLKARFMIRKENISGVAIGKNSPRPHKTSASIYPCSTSIFPLACSVAMFPFAGAVSEFCLLWMKRFRSFMENPRAKKSGGWERGIALMEPSAFRCHKTEYDSDSLVLSCAH